MTALCLSGYLPSSAFAQSRPYSLDDISELLAGGVKSAVVLERANKACITFRVTTGVEAQLRAAGAGDALIVGLRSACYKAPATSETTNPKIQPVAPRVVVKHDTVVKTDTLVKRDTVVVERPAVIPPVSPAVRSITSDPDFKRVEFSTGGGRISAGAYTGQLANTDFKLRNPRDVYDNWIFQGRKGQSVVVTLTSSDFAPHVFLQQRRGGPNVFHLADPPLGRGGDGHEARITATLPFDGDYIIHVEGTHDQGARGRYSLVLGF